jgi:hypothetical protein
MHDCCGYDDTSAKLSHSDNKRTIHTDRCEFRSQYRCKYTDGAGDQDNEKQADSQGYIIVVVRCSATSVDRSTIGINTMPTNCKLGPT